jgi:hypothetical protein
VPALPLTCGGQEYHASTAVPATSARTGTVSPFARRIAPILAAFPRTAIAPPSTFLIRADDGVTIPGTMPVGRDAVAPMPRAFAADSRTRIVCPASVALTV